MGLEDYQRSLTDYIRGRSEQKPFERADVYRRLFQGNMVSFLKDNKSEIHDALGEDFDGFVLEFYKSWESKTPFFYNISDEFLSYCKTVSTQQTTRRNNE
ncbi:hypothetical protein [uncultured Gammaproteobacteria bacterium]|uniref:HvfC/BufC N-terminal domain-containing protein n=1 Tax=Bathymodiolus heckerae thiotrophic gill symbiont TaxID=1052212 RepID=UPI0010FD3007|nr:DNA-binding domain-containing protein [Bathymodiolus heckerae thiotrophic gill symbiont]CAC9603198.1 hypothetical protein [uncultured Gammaproteobacteria bacterium]CAC9606407.1 hypothetical protein [uncultured Gammaproteobacteria bacterium]CAC9606707.1 hypothetical protein [uncultured Gammaproteobacteria bacterium]